MARHAITASHIDARRHGHGALVGGGCGKRGAVVGHVVALRPGLGQTLRFGRSKGSGSGRGSFLNSSAVMILVTCKSSSAGESLLAVGIGALVGSLARVRSSMASKRAAVAEGLGAGFAVVRFLASVHSLMYGQSRSLDELLPTVWPVAHMRSDATVNAFVSSEVASSRKSFSTSTTRIGLDGLLRSLRLRRLRLRHVLHLHTHAAHIWHFRVTRELHRGGHRIRDVHRRLHCCW